MERLKTFLIENVTAGKSDGENNRELTEREVEIFAVEITEVVLYDFLEFIKRKENELTDGGETK